MGEGGKPSKKPKVTTIYIQDIEKSLEQLRSKGYTIKDALRVGACFLNNAEEFFRTYKDILDSLEKHKQNINNMLSYIESTSLLLQTLMTTVRKMNTLTSDMKSSAQDIKEATNLMKKEHMERFKEVYDKLAYIISKTIEIDHKEIRLIIRYIEEDLNTLKTIYRIPENDPILTRIKNNINSIVMLCNKYIDLAKKLNTKESFL